MYSQNWIPYVQNPTAAATADYLGGGGNEQ
jgi:hypothetical protein